MCLVDRTRASVGSCWELRFPAKRVETSRGLVFLFYIKYTVIRLIYSAFNYRTQRRLRSGSYGVGATAFVLNAYTQSPWTEFGTTTIAQNTFALNDKTCFGANVFIVQSPFSLFSKNKKINIFNILTIELCVLLCVFTTPLFSNSSYYRVLIVNIEWCFNCSKK